MDTAEAVVEEVRYKVSKDGMLKLVVVLKDTVKLAGVMVKRATGHNAGNIRDTKIGAGSTLLVTRSGDVIPYIVAVLRPADEGQMPSVPYKIPLHVERDLGGPTLHCLLLSHRIHL